QVVIGSLGSGRRVVRACSGGVIVWQEHHNQVGQIAGFFELSKLLQKLVGTLLVTHSGREPGIRWTDIFVKRRHQRRGFDLNLSGAIMIVVEDFRPGRGIWCDGGLDKFSIIAEAETVSRCVVPKKPGASIGQRIVAIKGVTAGESAKSLFQV